MLCNSKSISISNIFNDIDIIHRNIEKKTFQYQHFLPLRSIEPDNMVDSVIFRNVLIDQHHRFLVPLIVREKTKLKSCYDKSTRKYDVKRIPSEV